MAESANVASFVDDLKCAMNNSGQSEKDASTGNPLVPPSTAKDGAPAQPATEQQLQEAEQKIEERMSGFERATLRLTRIGVFVGILTGVIFAGQLWEMHESGKQTDKLLSAANALARAAADQAQAAEDTATAAADQVDAANNFADTAEDINEGVSGAVGQLQSAAENTRTTIKNAQTAFRDEQRAWVGVQGTSDVNFSETEGLKVTVVFFNSA